MTGRVLLVDDDDEILASMQMRGRRHRQRWSFATASGGSAAIQKLATEPFDVVVTDLSMPGVTGGQVLAVAREARPSALRFVLSGRADRWLAKDAANAHQIFTKPADLDEVIDRAELAIAAREDLTPVEIASVTSGAGVPPSPRVFASLHAALTNPEYEIEAVARIVEQDLGLTSRVLQLASSSALGPRRSVSSVRSAVVVLGQRALEHLVLFEEAMSPSPRLTEQGLREHALLVGRIAVALDPGNRETFIAGVLHDLGHRVCDEADAAGGRHTLLGAYLAALWGFPRSIVRAVRDHHEPPPVTPPGLTGVIWAADRLATYGASALEDGSVEGLFGREVADAWRDASRRFFSQPRSENMEVGRSITSVRR